MTEKKQDYYPRNEVEKSTSDYFGGDELATQVWINKYCLKDSEGNLYEKNPDDMHRRLASELARIEAKYINPLSEEKIYETLKGFKRIVPQGSPMAGIGNDFQTTSLGNCFVIGNNADSYSGILRVDEEQAQLMKRRGGIGHDLSKIRPKGTPVKNSAMTSTGVVPFMERYSNSTRETAQCLHESTLVLTKEGLKKINDIKRGEYVWTENEWVLVADVLKNKKKTLKIKTKYGSEIIASEDHVFHTIEGEKKLKDFNDGDQITMIEGRGFPKEKYLKLKEPILDESGSRLVEHELPNTLDEKLGYILGYMYGNGSFYKKISKNTNNHVNTEINISCPSNNPPIIDKLKNLWEDTFRTPLNVKENKGNWVNLRISSQQIYKFLDYNDIAKGKADLLNFPSKIFKSPISVQLSFISGYFDADGYASNKKGYSISSIDKKFLLGVKNILFSIGISSKIHIEKRKNKGWNDLYTLCVVGANSKIKFKENLLESIKTNNANLNTKRDCILTTYKCDDILLKSKFNYVSDSDYLSTNVVRKILTEDVDTKISNPVLIQDFIEEITEYEENSNVFDLVLLDTHYFWANGFYAHNSGRRGALMLTISIKHPDAEEFIDAKMVKGKVTGANVSVKVDDDFMKSVLNDEYYIQHYPIEWDNFMEDEKTTDFLVKFKNGELKENTLYTLGKKHYAKIVNAKRIWKKVVHNAWKSAEPGFLLWDNILNESIPSVYGKKWIESSTNPCFSGKEELLTTQGYKTFEELCDLDDIKIINSEGNIVKSKVWCSGKKETINIHNSQGDIITCTPDHIWKTTDGNEVEAKDLLGKKLLPFITNEFHYGVINESPEITKIEDNGVIDVYDFIEPENHWGVVNGWIAHNCGELPLPPNDSCRLLALNLYGYVRNPFAENSSFDWELFKEDAEIAQRYMDDIIDLECEKIDRILDKIETDPEDNDLKRVELNLWKKIKDMALEGRRTGLGITGEGDMLAALGYTYGTDEGNKFSEKIHKQLKHFAYYSSVIMAKERGPFPMYDSEREKNNPFISRIKNEDPDLYNLMLKNGRRNIALLTVAPTGSLSILTQTTSGIEPVFLPAYKRRVKINPNDKNSRVDFTDEIGDHWMEYLVFHYNFKTWLEQNGYNVDEVKGMKMSEVQEIIKKSPYYKATSNDVDWVKKVEMQGLIQQHVDHSISVTVNLPNDVTEETVAKVYETGWRSKCKGITVYRDGSRSGVLISDDDKKEAKKNEMFKDNHAPKRPKRLKADIVRFQNNLEKWIAVVGKLDDRPYEFFTGRMHNGLSELPTTVEQCEVVKKILYDDQGNRTKRYDIEYIDSNGEKVIYEGINQTFDPEYWNYAKLISSVMRHGMPTSYIYELVRSLNLNDEHLNTWKAGVERVIKRYIKDGEKTKDIKCPECKSNNLEFKEGCLICIDCGNSKCS